MGGEFRLLTTGLNGRPTAADLSDGRFATLTIDGTPPKGWRPIDGTLPKGFFDLTKAKAGSYNDGPAERWPRNIILDGFEYGAIQVTSPAVREDREWLKDREDRKRLKRLKDRKERERLREREQWLSRAMNARLRRSGGVHDAYLPQPYDQLAAAYSRTGDDHSARLIQLAKYRQRNRVTSWRRRWYSKVWNYVQDWAIGYGYVPWRALLVLAALLVAGAVLFRYAGAFRPYSIVTVHHHASFTLNNSASYTLDLLLPTSALDARQVWQSNGPGEVAASFLVALGLLLTATVFAGVARVLQRN